MYRLAAVSDHEVQWTLRRNCAVSPQQLGMMFLILSGFSLLVAAFFWSQGVWMVLPFTALELLVVAAAFLVYARHAVDGERITLRDGQLLVELEEAGRFTRFEWARHTVRVEAPVAQRPLVWLRSGGRVLEVGRFIRQDLRPVLARELQWALQRA